MAAGEFLAGFGETDITPERPVLLGGYYYDRRSTGVHDRLYARSMAVSGGGRRVVLCVADVLHLPEQVVARTRSLVREECGLAPEELILSAAHTHTGPDVEKETEYVGSLPRLLADSVRSALDDLSPCTLDAARGEETTLQFIRRYRMKDGSVVTNPGILNPDVVGPIGEPDPALHVLIAREDSGRPRGGVVHYALHCDTVGGTEISADWSHYLRQRMRERLGEGLHLLTPIGPAGDVNHWNVFREASLRGFAETERIGRRIADAALEALEHAVPLRPGPVCAVREAVEVEIRVPSDEELAEARRLLAEPPPDGVDFTMERVEAMRKVRAAEMGPTVKLDVTVHSFGGVALVGMPVELFSELGRRIKQRSPFDHTLVVTLADGYIGYVGTVRNYEEGGYETTSAVVAPGTGERLVEAAVRLLNSVRTSS